MSLLQELCGSSGRLVYVADVGFWASSNFPDECRRRQGNLRVGRLLFGAQLPSPVSELGHPFRAAGASEWFSALNLQSVGGGLSLFGPRDFEGRAVLFKYLADSRQVYGLSDDFWRGSCGPVLAALRWQRFGFYPERFDLWAVCPAVGDARDGSGSDLRGDCE